MNVIRTDAQVQEAQLASTQIMLDAGSLTEAAPRVISAICQSLNWDLGAVWEVDPTSETLHCVGVWSSDPEFSEFEEVTHKTVFKKGAVLPGLVLESGLPEWISDIADAPNLVRSSLAAKLGLHGGFAFPIISEREVLGVIEFFSSQVKEPDRYLLNMMETIGNQIGQLMRRQRIEEELRDSQAQLEFLAHASRTLSSSLDFEKVLEEVARLAVPGIADWCAVDLLQEDGSIERVARVGTAEVSQDPESILGAHHIIRTGKGEVYSEVPDGLLESLETRSAMIVPLKARGRVFGTMSFAISDSPRRYDEKDLNFAQDLADRAALAIDNARLFSKSSKIAEALQKSLLPPNLPRIPGLDLASGYQSVGSESEVGGDFFDIFRTGSKNWSVVIGDVCGKGLPAAAMTALARHTLRAAAMERKKPSRILKVLNEAILMEHADSQFCSAIYLALKISPDGALATIASGGHPPPLILRANGSAEPVVVSGTLLGLFPDPELTDVKVSLEAGDVLVLYTDGLIEARGTGEIFGEDRLLALLKGCRGLSASEVVARIESEVLAFQEKTAARDDIAYVVLKVAA